MVVKIVKPVPGKAAIPVLAGGKVVNLKYGGLYDFYVGRNGSRYHVPPSKDADLGNPFPIGDKYTRKQSVAKFERYARNLCIMSESYKARIVACHNKTLACHCAPELCHASVILKLAAEFAAKEKGK